MKQNQQGSVLIIALITIATIATTIGIAVAVTSSTGRITRRSDDQAAVQAAAEGAIDYAYGTWKATLNSQFRAISAAEAVAALGTAPAFPGMSYLPSAQNGPLQVTPIDPYGRPSSNASPMLISLPNYPGWRGRSYRYVATARLQNRTLGSNVVSGAKRFFEYSEVPLFQSMAFFEGNLELYRPAPMIIGGLVHTNATAYVSGSSSQSVTFTGNLSYSTKYTSTEDPPFANTWSGWSANAKVSPIYPSGEANQVSQVERLEPLGDEPAAVLNTTDANPNNDSMRELIEVPNSSFSDPTPIAQRRLFNKAGLVVKVTGSTVAVTTQNGTTLTSAQTTAIKAAITTGASMYDRREGKTVGVTNVDISALNATLNTSALNFNNVLYIYDSGSTTTNPKAVRLVNGGVLPNAGLTVASQDAVYIQGDYNTGTTTNPTSVPSNAGGNPNNTDSPTVSGYTRKPSSVMGDAVTILSNNWSDANSSKALSSRPAVHTTVNTAIVSGFLASGYTNSAGQQYGYSGGLNNFPRFLESWSGNDFTYFGSMVQLYESKFFTGEWDTGAIYSPPARKWNFDDLFTDNPPPGSVDAVSTTRGAWARF